MLIFKKDRINKSLFCQQDTQILVEQLRTKYFLKDIFKAKGEDKM
jgi:hypothetical protein